MKLLKIILLTTACGVAFAPCGRAGIFLLDGLQPLLKAVVPQIIVSFLLAEDLVKNQPLVARTACKVLASLTAFLFLQLMNYMLWVGQNQSDLTRNLGFVFLQVALSMLYPPCLILALTRKPQRGSPRQFSSTTQRIALSVTPLAILFVMIVVGWRYFIWYGCLGAEL